MNQRSSAKLPVSPRPPKSRIYNSALDPHDAAHRVSAFIYGNILVLAALVTINPHAIHDGHGVLIVLDAETAWYTAVGVVAVRLLLNGALVAKYRGEKVTLRTMLSGIVLAVVALAVALLKAHLTH